MTVMTERKKQGQFVSLEDARRLLARGTDLLDPRDLEDCPVKIPQGDIPPPVTAADLAAIKASNESLVLALPLTGKELHDATGNRLSDGGKLLYEVSWYAQEAFYLKEPAVSEPTWLRMHKTVLPESTGHNFLEQTADLAQALEKLGEAMPEKAPAALAEFRERQDELRQLLKSDWPQAAKELAALKLNQLHRPNFVLELYHCWLHQALNGERLFQNIYSWTKSLSSGGGLVGFGVFDSCGADVFDWRPFKAFDSLGVCFSAEVKS